MRQDREINRLNREIFRTGDRDRRRPRHARVGDAHDPRRPRAERIGDNAVDIGEQVAFVVTGLFREFSDQLATRRRAPRRRARLRASRNAAPAVSDASRRASEARRAAVKIL